MTGPGEEPQAVQMRIGDTERNVVVQRLQTALGEGRLDIGEFDERLAQVYAARTFGDLQPITADLPVTSSTATAPVSMDKDSMSRGATPRRDRQRARHGNLHGRDRNGDIHRRGGTDAWLFWAWRAWAIAVSVNVVIWLFVSLGNQDLAYFWPMWVAGPWGALLLVNTLMRPRR